MPKVMIIVSTNQTNVAFLQPQDEIDDENIKYYFKVTVHNRFYLAYHVINFNIWFCVS